jgi:large subunit ribosomal protein L28
MSRVCDVTGRRTRIGHQVKRRGLAKKDGGVGRRVTGRSKRTFKPNIQPVRVLTPDGQVVTLKLSTKVIKRGIITLKKGDKTVSYPLVKAVRGRNRAFSKAQKVTKAQKA